MSVSRGAAYARRHLRSALRKHREYLPQMTQKAVGVALDWSPSKIMRIEKGHVGVTRTDLESLLDLYQVTDQARRAELLDMQRTGRAGTSQIKRYRSALSKVFAEYLEEEEAASIIRNYEPLFVPGPLQTPDYARRMLEFFGTYEQPDPDEPVDAEARDLAQHNGDLLQRRLDVRMIRKGFLTAGRGLEGFFILTDAALRLRVGNESGRPDLMLAQLEHLKQLDAAHPNINIQVVSGSAGLYSRYMRFPFIVLEFDDDEMLLLQEEQVAEQTVREDSDEVGKARDDFQAMQALASPPEEFGAIVQDAIQELRNG